MGHNKKLGTFDMTGIVLALAAVASAGENCCAKRLPLMRGRLRIYGRLGRVPFKGKGQVAALPASPEVLYRDLPRRPDAVLGLWLHQGDLLRAYAADHVDAPDLALELPTGTGKTLPGLLIGSSLSRAGRQECMWRLRRHSFPGWLVAGDAPLRVRGRFSGLEGRFAFPPEMAFGHP